MRDIQYRDDGRPEDLLQELGYETQDIQYKKFSVYGAYFFGFFLFSIISGFVFLYFMSPTKLHGGRMGDYIPKTDMPLAAPLLQSNITARTDIMSLRRNETAALDSAGVVDKAHGVYRIPVEQAIDDVAKESDTDKAAMGLPGAAPTLRGRQQSLADIMTEPDYVEPTPTSDDLVVNDPAAIKKLAGASSKPVRSQKPTSNTNRGESATTQPKGGNGG